MIKTNLLEQIDNLISKIESWQSESEKKKAMAKATSGEMTLDKKMHYITRNLAEVMNDEKARIEMRQIMKERPLKIYWGTATTGAPHVAYFIPLCKIGDFLKAGCEVTILFADLHAFLDAGKTPWELLDHRVAYYKAIITSMLRAVDVPLDKLNFVRGSDFQLTPKYTLDMYKLCAKTSVNSAKRAGAEVVKQSDNPELAPVIYPLLQALDEEYLGVDVQFGGVDQRKIFAYASDNLNKHLGYKSRIHLMNGICPSLMAGADGSVKMSSSNKDSKIDVLDDSKSVKRKLNKAFCEPGNVETNGILSFCKFVVFPCFLDGKEWTIARKGEDDICLTCFDELRDAFQKEAIHPADLKAATFKILDGVLDRVRADFTSPEMQSLRGKAYPSGESKKENKPVESTPERDWILNFHKENSELPSIKQIRQGTKMSKRNAKRLLNDIAKEMGL